MNRKPLFELLFFICLLSVGLPLSAQLRQYKHLPDFDYADYDMHLKFMNRPFAMLGQTLYLQDVSDSNLSQYFFVGQIAVPEKGDKSGVQYYKLSRMSKDRIKSLQGEWFIVKDYIADQFAYNKIYQAVDRKRDFRNMQYPFMKLIVGSTRDTL